LRNQGNNAFRDNKIGCFLLSLAGALQREKNKELKEMLAGRDIIADMFVHCHEGQIVATIRLYIYRDSYHHSYSLIL